MDLHYRRCSSVVGRLAPALLLAMVAGGCPDDGGGGPDAPLGDGGDAVADLAEADGSAPADTAPGDTAPGDTAPAACTAVEGAATAWTLDGEVPAEIYGSVAIIRRVGADLLVQFQWSGKATDAAPPYRETRGWMVGVRLVGAADVTTWSGALATGEVVPLASALLWGGPSTHVAGAAALDAACVTARRGDEGWTVSASVAGTAPGFGGDAAHALTAAVSGTRWNDDIRAMTRYAGQCDAAWTRPSRVPLAPYYLPVQYPDSWLLSWDTVDFDCSQTGCYNPEIYACGGGDRYRCAACGDEVCLQPVFVSECLPGTP